MKVTEIAIYAGDVERPYKIIGEISAKVQAASVFSARFRSVMIFLGTTSLLDLSAMLRKGYVKDVLNGIQKRKF